MNNYNNWSETKTRNGFTADEIISSLQKAIRRNMPEEACKFAYELYISGPIFLDKLWRRLIVISVEDIGFGNINAASIVETMDNFRKRFPYDDGDQPMFFIHAIRVLCESTKDRSSDYLKNIIIKEAAMGQLPEIMDVGLDKHTKRGQEMGRDSFHFFYEGAKVIPELEVNNDYKARYEEILKTYDAKKAKHLFPYNKVQY